MSIKDRPQQPDNIFSIIPIEVFMDDRLTKTDLRVLGAIMSWRNKDTNLMWPKREQIARRCNLPLCKISTATTHLVNLGWLKKDGNGGCSRATQYQFLVPDLSLKTVTDSVTVTKTVTVPKSVTKTVTDSVTKTVTKSVRGIKQTNEQTNEHKVINKISGFVIPTLEEVSAHISEKKYNLDPELFIAHYKSNGWMVGKNKMKCWKSAMVTWAKRERPQSYSPKQPAQRPDYEYKPSIFKQMEIDNLKTIDGERVL